jgi:hypothetical protein
MFRYRNRPFSPIVKPMEVPVESAIQEFLTAHARKGDSQRYLTELESYLVGKDNRTNWEPLQR